MANGGARMIRLEKRPQPSRAWSLATPLVAVITTMIVGGLLFGALGTNPVEAIRTIFWDPLFGATASYSRPQLLVKAGPLVLIAIGLSLGFRAGIWNIGAEGQYIIGALVGAGKSDALTGAALTQGAGFQGVSGIFRLRPDGTNERGLAVATIQNKQVVVIDPAPTSFSGAGS